MEEESLAMSLLKDYKKNNKRMFALLVIILILWFATIGSFVWYINQFDFVTETTTLDGNGSTTITVGSLPTSGATDTQIPIVKNVSLIIKRLGN